MDEVNLLASLRDGAWLDRQRFAPLQWAIPGVMPEGSVLVAGAPKIGKSWLCLDAALAIAAGGQTLGIPVGEARPVLFLALEDSDRRLQDRCRILLGPGEHIPAGFMYLTEVAPNLVLDTVREWLDKHGTERSLVIVDTLGKVMPPARVGESAYERDYRVGAAFKRLVDEVPGTTIWISHHDRKAASDDFVDRVSGSNGLAGAADTVIVLSRPRGEQEGLLAITGRENTAEGEFAVVFHEARWMLDGADLREAGKRARQRKVTAGLGERSSEILELVADHPEGLTPAQAGEKLGISNDDAGKYLRRLYEAGRIERVGRGRYTPVRSVRTSETDRPDSISYVRERGRFGHSDSSDGGTTGRRGAEVRMRPTSTPFTVYRVRPV